MAMWWMVRLGVMVVGVVVVLHTGAIANAVASRLDPSYQSGQVQVTIQRAMRGLQQAGQAL